MGIGIVILFWLSVSGMLFAGYLGLRALGRISRKANLLKNVFVAVVAAVAIPIAVLIVTNFVLGFFPSYVFRSTFGFDPPPSISELEGGKSVFGDSGEIYLRFRTDKTTINRIADARFVELNEEQAKHLLAQLSKGSSGGSLFASPTTRVYRAVKFDESFGSSTATLMYDEASGVTEFYWLGID